jgi:transposase
MPAAPTTVCPNCDKLRAQLEALQAEVVALREEIASLRKNSSTSSKPPSSDIVKPPKPAPPPGQAKRQPGGQPGHPKHERALLPPERLTAPPHEYRLERCPDCQANLHPANLDPRILQQIELPELPFSAEEHRAHAGHCPHCHKIYYAPFPAEILAGGLAGPRLTTLIAYMKGACHASFSTIRKFLRDIVGLQISRGQLRNIINKVSEALEGPYQELLDNLRKQPIVNADETGHKQNGDRMWTWCFRASLYTLFKIDPTRKTDVLIEVLGKEFEGVLGCDYFSSYRSYMERFDIRVQFCLAHLIRDVKYLTTLPDWRDQVYGMSLGGKLRQLFKVIHERETLPPAEFQARLERARQEVLRVSQYTMGAAASEVMGKRFKDHGEAYFTFITTPGVEPTNNLAEQAIRFVVIDRLITQGTRSEGGNRWCERIWTVIATCAQQGRSVFDYLYEAVKAHFSGSASPSLMPESA